MRQFTVAGVFNSGHYEFDSAMSFINLTDAEKLMRTQTPGGIRLKLSNMQDARESPLNSIIKCRLVFWQPIGLVRIGLGLRPFRSKNA